MFWYCTTLDKSAIRIYRHRFQQCWPGDCQAGKRTSEWHTNRMHRTVPHHQLRHPERGCLWEKQRQRILTRLLMRLNTWHEGRTPFHLNTARSRTYPFKTGAALLLLSYLESGGRLTQHRPKKIPTNSKNPFHTRTHTFLTSHPASRSTFLASHNTNRSRSESTMMTGTRYINSNSSNIHSNLSETISHTRLFPTINILKISEIWKYSGNFILTKSLIDRRLLIVLTYQDSFISITWEIRVKVPVYSKSEVVRCK